MTGSVEVEPGVMMTGTAAELLKGYTGILKGSDDEPVRGTLGLTGNAQAAHVLNGETFYSNDAKTKHTGNMTVNSLLSFSVAAYSGRRVIATGQIRIRRLAGHIAELSFDMTREGILAHLAEFRFIKERGTTILPELLHRRFLICRI